MIDTIKPIKIIKKISDTILLLGIMGIVLLISGIVHICHYAYEFADMINTEYYMPGKIRKIDEYFA